MKTILLTHSDLDGFGCYLTFCYFNIPFDKAIICDYNQFDSDENFKQLLEYESIICTDYSLTKELVERLLVYNKKVLIIDHHDNDETQKLNDIKHENFQYIFDNEKSGTLLTFEHFKLSTVRIKKILLDLIILIDTYDLFKTDNEFWNEAQNLNRVFYGCLSWGEEGIDKYKFIKDFWLNKISKYNTWEWTKYEKERISRALQIEEKSYINASSTYKSREDDRGNKFGIVVVDKKVSIVANRLLNEKKDIKYLIVVNNYSGKWDKLSLRSLDEDIFDVTSFEEVKGHKCASGGEVDPKFAADLYRGVKNLTYKHDKV